MLSLIRKIFSDNYYYIMAADVRIESERNSEIMFGRSRNVVA